ncbi:MAG TPA: DUF4055 domain-containing protein [Quisquiliibacterium sp.]|nr:DUF4055 domain-containing protein [Quisquiliibacterium sp.]
MPVDSTHPDYDAAAPKWRRMRDVIAGQDAVHAAGVLYLPKLKDQTDDDYKAYKTRTPWFGATSRTIDALHGLQFRKAPAIEAPAGLAAALDDVTLAGQSAVEFVAGLARETLEVGRVGALVDFPAVAGVQLTRGAAEAGGIRPFATLYKAETIRNWRVQRVANRMTLTFVVLSESYTAESDGYADKDGEQLRVLKLDGGIYVQEIWRKNERNDWALVDTITPTVNGRALAFIPFVIVGPEHVGAEVSDPPLIDMADLNLSHYRTMADLEHGAHYTGLPMLMLAGVEAEGPIYLGSQRAVVATNPDAKGWFIEFAGQGLGALEKLIERKEAQMAALGASMLAAPKRGVEAAQTHEMRTAQETSALADIAATVGKACTQVLRWIADWSQVGGEVRCTVSTDYVVTRMTAQELTALMGLWQSGAISRSTLFWNLQQGELIQQGKTLEDEQGEIEAEGPALGMAGNEGSGADSGGA